MSHLTPDQSRVIQDIWNAKSGFEQGIIAGRETERSRIIKLIEANDWEFTIIGDDGVKYELGDELIALIKGKK
jgi:hypothetical protein